MQAPSRRLRCAANRLRVLRLRRFDDALHRMNYKESNNEVFRIAKERLGDAEVGSTVLFGSFPQGSVRSGESSSVEWLVLDKDGSKRLLISKYVLICLPYMSMSPDDPTVSWSSSFLRDWLNKEFLDYTFDAAEMRFVTRTVVSADPNPNYPAADERTTTDKVFLLSITEALKYFPTDEERICYATRFAIEYGAYQSSVGKGCWWWLRTLGSPASVLSPEDSASYTATRVSGVGTSGEIITVGHEVYNFGYGVRPAMWIDLEASETKPLLVIRPGN